MIVLSAVAVAGIIAIVFGVVKNEIQTSTFWFLLSFWLSLVVPLAIR